MDTIARALQDLFGFSIRVECLLFGFVSAGEELKTINLKHCFSSTYIL